MPPCKFVCCVSLPDSESSFFQDVCLFCTCTQRCKCYNEAHCDQHIIACLRTRVSGNKHGVFTPNSQQKITDFVAGRLSYVYVLYDSRGTADKGGLPPTWLTTGFTKLEDQVEVMRPMPASCGALVEFHLRKACMPDLVTNG